jgi:hypothetical protein
LTDGASNVCSQKLNCSAGRLIGDDVVLLWMRGRAGGQVSKMAGSKLSLSLSHQNNDRPRQLYVGEDWRIAGVVVLAWWSRRRAAVVDVCDV